MAENNLHESFKARSIPHLQQLTASQIRIGLAFAEILDSMPKYAHATAVKAMGELIKEAG